METKCAPRVKLSLCQEDIRRQFRRRLVRGPETVVSGPRQAFPGSSIVKKRRSRANNSTRSHSSRHMPTIRKGVRDSRIGGGGILHEDSWPERQNTKFHAYCDSPRLVTRNQELVSAEKRDSSSGQRSFSMKGVVEQASPMDKRIRARDWRRTEP